MRVVLCLILWLSGCASPGVHCDGRLTAINRPAAIVPPGRTASGPSETTP